MDIGWNSRLWKQHDFRTEGTECKEAYLHVQPVFLLGTVTDRLIQFYLIICNANYTLHWISFLVFKVIYLFVCFPNMAMTFIYGWFSTWLMISDISKTQRIIFLF